MSIIKFDTIFDSHFFGNKASNILRLYKLGFNIPTSYIVIPPLELIPKYLLLSRKLYILRSSFSIEDGDKYSFAGVFESKLIFDSENILNGYKELISNVFSPDRTKYFKFLGINKKQIQAFFLLQEYIVGDYSGVYFSSYNGCKVLEYVKGENSLLVDGKVDASKVFIKTCGYEYQYFQQDYFMHFGEKKGLWKKIHLPEKYVDQLISLFTLIQEIFGFEVDIEWTIKNKKIYILQVRNITT